ncbi:seryl-tRNA synthetase [Dichotomocladium elegans]|nr:seryl-tRNA synthetase [Dichotomocladium elegans]
MLQRCLASRPLCRRSIAASRALSARCFGISSIRKADVEVEATAQHQRIRPQLNYKHFVDNSDAIERNIRVRNYDGDHVHQIKKLYLRKEQILQEQAHLSAERDAANGLIRGAKSREEREKHIAQGKAVKEKLKALGEELAAVEEDMCYHGLMVPNDTHPDVPIGPEENARVIKVFGTPLQQSEPPLEDHLTIAERLGLVDFGQAAKVSGSKFYYLKSGGAWLEMALIQYAMDRATSRGFLPVITPDVVRTSVAYGCGFQPRKSEASQIYDVSTASTVSTTAPKLCLTGTAEIPLAGMFADKMLKEEDLPQRVVGFGRAFRAEAGHGSAEERGLYRVHQFSKVELFAVSTPQQSDGILEELRGLQEELFTELGLCVRILDMPTEELGASAYRKYDMEAWMPGRGNWGEISSTSNCTDYQTRRLNIRYLSSEFKDKVGPKDVRVPWHIKEKWVQFCHTLNGTAIAVPRVIIAILETHQQPDGSVRIPEVLRKWIPGQPTHLR